MRDSRRLHHQQLQLAERLSNASTTVGLGGYDMDLGATAATVAATQQAHASTKESAHSLCTESLMQRRAVRRTRSNTNGVDPPQQFSI